MTLFIKESDDSPSFTVSQNDHFKCHKPHVQFLRSGQAPLWSFCRSYSYRSVSFTCTLHTADSSDFKPQLRIRVRQTSGSSQNRGLATRPHEGRRSSIGFAEPDECLLSHIPDPRRGFDSRLRAWYTARSAWGKENKWEPQSGIWRFKVTVEAH